MITLKIFQTVMEEVDEGLRSNNVAIHARPMHSVGEVAKKLQITKDIPIIVHKNVPEVFSPELIYTHIHDWYENRYGERLKINMGPGSVAILIKGTPWEVKLPLILGSVRLTCDTNVSAYKNMPKMGLKGQIPVFNVLLAIRDLPETLARELSVEEQLYIFDNFRVSLNALQTLSNHSSEPYIEEALVDLNSAVNNLVGQNAHYGVSKWASLQFTEKIIKSKLQISGIIFPNTHKLEKLSEVAQRNNLLNLCFDDLQKIQCSAGVRYGEETVSLISAMEAHHKSIKVSSEIFSEDSYSYRA